MPSGLVLTSRDLLLLQITGKPPFQVQPYHSEGIALSSKKTLINRSSEPSFHLPPTFPPSLGDFETPELWRRKPPASRAELFIRFPCVIPEASWHLFDHRDAKCSAQWPSWSVLTAFLSFWSLQLGWGDALPGTRWSSLRADFCTDKLTAKNGLPRPLQSPFIEMQIQ